MSETLSRLGPALSECRWCGQKIIRDSYKTAGVWKHVVRGEYGHWAEKEVSE